MKLSHCERAAPAERSVMIPNRLPVPGCLLLALPDSAEPSYRHQHLLEVSRHAQNSPSP